MNIGGLPDKSNFLPQAMRRPLKGLVKTNELIKKNRIENAQ